MNFGAESKYVRFSVLSSHQPNKRSIVDVHTTRITLLCSVQKPRTENCTIALQHTGLEVVANAARAQQHQNNTHAHAAFEQRAAQNNTKISTNWLQIGDKLGCAHRKALIGFRRVKLTRCSAEKAAQKNGQVTQTDWNGHRRVAGEFFRVTPHTQSYLTSIRLSAAVAWFRISRRGREIVLFAEQARLGVICLFVRTCEVNASRCHLQFVVCCRTNTLVVRVLCPLLPSPRAKYIDSHSTVDKTFLETETFTNLLK